MSLANRRELVFLYTVKDANPNGDPLNENHPRYDEDTMQAMASDVRIKRTIRDEWMRNGLNVFVNAEAKSLKERVDELKTIIGKADAKEVMQECIDVRLFGVTFALGREAFSWCGPVQFKWARSLHAATFQLVQGTSAFARETAQDRVKEQRSFRNEYKVPFALMCVYGIVNQYAALKTGATDEDVDQMLHALWSGTDNLISRSKTEHKARLLLEIAYRTGFSGKIAGLDEKIRLVAADGHSLNREEQQALRSLAEIRVDVSSLVDAILRHAGDIQRVRLTTDPDVCLAGDGGLVQLGDKLTREVR